MLGDCRFWTLCAGLSLVSTVALAAEQPPAPDHGQSDPQTQDNNQPITVTGKPEADRAQTNREAARFFDSHAVPTRIGQLARWHEPICARTGGLPPELSARIATRIMDIADSVGAPTNRAERCTPNVRLGFSSEPQEMLKLAYRRNRLVVGFHYAARTKEVLQVRQPVQAWYVTTTRALPISGSLDRANTVVETIDEAGTRTPGGSAGSRFTTGTSSRLAHVLILADTRVVEGQDADSIAELLAFLTLAQTPVAESCDASDTILNLMNPACPPEQRPAALTRQDIAYLRALYTMNPEAGSRLQRGHVVIHMTDTLRSDE